MATSYGGWSNHTRVWFDYSPSSDATHFYVHVDAYMQLESGWYSNATRLQEWWGFWGSGSSNQLHNFGNGQSVLIVDGGTYSAERTDSDYTISFGATGRNYNGAASHTLTLTVPARVPLAPTDLAVSRVSDSQHTVSWTRNGTYSQVAVQRSPDEVAWAEVGRPGSNPASFSDLTTAANGRFYYRVASVTAGGQSAWSAVVGPVFTTPAAPTGVSAARSGTDIVVSVAGVPPFASSFDVWDGASKVGDGVSLPWTHVSPNPSVTHTYTVAGRAGSLTGPQSAPSNTVQLLTKPNPPTNLTPNGGVTSVEGGTRFSWTHNPVDTTAQTAYELRYRVGVDAWTTLSGTTASFRDVSLPLGDFEWQSRTKGEHPDWSDWSAIATVTVINRPGVAVLTPAGTWDRAVLSPTWSYFQAQSRPQSGFQAELLDADMVVLEARTGAGAAGTVAFTTRVADGGTYTVRVRAATGDVWSEWGQQTFTVAYTKPNDPTFTGSWNDVLGFVDITVVAGQADDDTPATVQLEVERSIDGGVSWELLLFSAELEVTFPDWTSLSNGTNLYRVTGFTADGASAETITTVDANSDAVWLSGGVGYATTARLPLNPVVELEPGRERASVRYAGSELPVAYSGDGISRVYRVNGWVAKSGVVTATVTADVEALERLALTRSPIHLLRDPDGRRVYGVIGSIPMPRLNGRGYWGYQFQIEETQH